MKSKHTIARQVFYMEKFHKHTRKMHQNYIMILPGMTYQVVLLQFQNRMLKSTCSFLFAYAILEII